MAGLWSDGVHQELFLVFCAQRVRQVRNIRGLDEARLFIFTLKSNQLKRVSLVSRARKFQRFNEREAHS